MRPARRSGSGRSPARTPSAASPNVAAHNRYGPVSAASPVLAAARCAGSARFGPMTMPSVVAPSTVPRARPRRCGAARSVPAYRAARFVAVAAPSGTHPSSSSGQLRISTATAAATAPTAALRYPTSNADRRPARTAIRAVDTAVSAAPPAMHISASPPTTSEPESRVADNAAIATPAPTPAPPRICVRTSTTRIRRCTWWIRRVCSSSDPVAAGSSTQTAAARCAPC